MSLSVNILNNLDALPRDPVLRIVLRINNYQILQGVKGFPTGKIVAKLEDGSNNIRGSLTCETMTGF